MLSEFSAREIGLQVIEHLERRRPAIVSSQDMVMAEVKNALVPVRRAYAELELPMGYMDALEEELGAALPTRWMRVAEPFTRLEQSDFRLWRGGDVVARLSYVLIGLVLGGLIVEAPFIPIWEKWFPFVLAVAAWWLPDVQVRWQKRRYSKSLGAIVATLERAQPALDRHITFAELMPPERPHE